MAGVTKIIFSKEAILAYKKIISNKKFQRICVKIGGGVAALGAGIFCGKGVSNVLEYNRQNQK